MNLMTMILPVLTAFSSYAGSIDMGVVDGGGGEVGTSSELEVRAAIATAWDLATREAILENPLTSLIVTLEEPLDESKLSRGERLLFFPFESKNAVVAKQKFHKAMDDYIEGRIDKTTHDAISELWLATRSYPSILKKSPIAYSKKCYDKYGNEKDGSVQSFEVGSPICLSLTGLSRLPKSALVHQILGLLVHESMHLWGEDETVAYAAQDRFLDEFQSSQRRKGLIRMEYEVRVAFGFMKFELEHLSGSDLQKFKTLSVHLGKMLMVSEITREAGMFKAMPYARPELQQEFSKKLQGLIEELEMMTREYVADPMSLSWAKVPTRMLPHIDSVEKAWVQLVWGNARPEFSN